MHIRMYMCASVEGTKCVYCLPVCCASMDYPMWLVWVVARVQCLRSLPSCIPQATYRTNTARESVVSPSHNGAPSHHTNTHTHTHHNLFTPHKNPSIGIDARNWYDLKMVLTFTEGDCWKATLYWMDGTKAIPTGDRQMPFVTSCQVNIDTVVSVMWEESLNRLSKTNDCITSCGTSQRV